MVQCLLLLLAFVAFPGAEVDGKIVDVVRENFTDVIEDEDMVLVFYHSTFCPFSSLLVPVLWELDSLIAQDWQLSNKVLIAFVDCDKEKSFCIEKFVDKVPTLRLYDHGVQRHDYRKGRNARALLSYLRDFASPYIVELSPGQRSLIKVSEQAVIYYNPGGTPATSTMLEGYNKAARHLRELCNFYIVFQEDVLQDVNNVAPDSVIFKPHRYELSESYTVYKPGDVSLFDWILEQCYPLVQHLTFENAEEILDGDLPIMILIYKSGDRESIELFKKRVEEELKNYHDYMKFATCEGELFLHPLKHLGKSLQDLPLIVLDSMEHMYLFPDFQLLKTEKSLIPFASAYFTSQLHNLYHKGEIGQLYPQLADTPQVTSPPPESVFSRLKPSKKRYTMIHEEF